MARGKALTIRLTVESSTNIIVARFVGNVTSFSRLLRLRHREGIALEPQLKTAKLEMQRARRKLKERK
jgi:hypothetical protein